MVEFEVILGELYLPSGGTGSNFIMLSLLSEVLVIFFFIFSFSFYFNSGLYT